MICKSGECVECVCSDMRVRKKNTAVWWKAYWHWTLTLHWIPLELFHTQFALSAILSRWAFKWIGISSPMQVFHTSSIRIELFSHRISHASHLPNGAIRAVSLFEESRISKINWTMLHIIELCMETFKIRTNHALLWCLFILCLYRSQRKI